MFFEESLTVLLVLLLGHESLIGVVGRRKVPRSQPRVQVGIVGDRHLERGLERPHLSEIRFQASLESRDLGQGPGQEDVVDQEVLDLGGILAQDELDRLGDSRLIVAKNGGLAGRKKKKTLKKPSSTEAKFRVVLFFATLL